MTNHYLSSCPERWAGGQVSAEAKAERRPKKKRPLYVCLECGRKFHSHESAERAAFGDDGCPGCGGSDIDLYVGG